jgi:periplasmic protein TonB
MENEKNINWDEMVFEFKNKDYGAYFLRSNYRKYIIRSSTIALIILALIVGPPFIMAKLNKENKTMIDNSVTADLMNIKQQEDLPPPPPPPPPPPELKQEAKFVAPVVVDSVEEKVEIATTDQMIATTTNDAVVEEVVEVVETVVEEEAPAFIVVEEMPVFPGGEAEMLKYIAEKIEYPQICKEMNISGKVFVNFVVNENGKVEKVKVVRGVDPYLDKEAIRVIQSLPDWTPGRQRGKAVKVQFTIPINFALY